jgi:hypothetical protein
MRVSGKLPALSILSSGKEPSINNGKEVWVHEVANGKFLELPDTQKSVAW